jgi:hypothetical protein
MKFYIPESYRGKAERYGFRGRFLSQIVTALVDTLESKLSEEELRVYELAIQAGLFVPSRIVLRRTQLGTARNKTATT